MTVIQISSGVADTLTDALAHAYSYNTELQSARAHLRGVDEQIPQALAGWRPTVTINASGGRQNYHYGVGQLLPAPLAYRQWDYGGNLQIKMPLYSGGGTAADVARAEATVRAGRADLLGTEQTVLLQAATAYDDVLRARAVASLDREIEKLLKQKLQEITLRMQAGQLTQTDVDQTASRLAEAAAARIGAEGDLSAAVASFVAAVGRPPDANMSVPGLPPGLPKTSDEAVRLADASNPTVTASLFRMEAAEHSVKVAHAALLPNVSVTGQVGADQGQSFPTVPTNDASLTVNLTVPLYQGGAASSRLKQATEGASESHIQSLTARRDARKNAETSYAQWRAATDRWEQQKIQVKLAESAYDGVRREAAVGATSTFELLGQLQELYAARNNEVQARYDVAINAYQLLVAVGRFKAADLHLPAALYDPAAEEKSGEKVSPLPR